jgi:hypothetical protein
MFPATYRRITSREAADIHFQLRLFRQKRSFVSVAHTYRIPAMKFLSVSFTGAYISRALEMAFRWFVGRNKYEKKTSQCKAAVFLLHAII